MVRREDFRLITGHGRYTADWNLPNQLHAVFLRADRAHAEIARLDVTRALAFPGVRAVLTGDDARQAGFNSLANGVPFPGKDGQQIRKAHYPVLAQGRVRFVGEPVAMIVADTPTIGEDARELIEIDYRDLPAVSSFDAAVKDGAPQLHADVPGNLAFEFESGDEPAVAAAFARARYTSKVTVESQRLVGNALEPRACLVAFNPANGAYTIHVPLQGVGGMRNQIAQATGLDKDKIILVAQDVGGSFGVRGAAYAEYFTAMLAARKLGRPVKWVATRAEVFMSDFQGRALSLTGELAIDADGKFLAIRFDDRADLGAYAAAFGPFIATRNVSVTAGGVYRIPAIYVRSRLAHTNTVPVSAYRGAGRPDIAYAIERLVDYAAHEHGFDPIELRRKNFVPRDAMPYKTANAGTYDSGDFEGVMDDALRRADWRGFPARKRIAKRNGKIRGIGVATYLEAGGGGAAPKDQVAVEFDRKGAMTLFAVTQSSGQGHETVFPQIVAGELGIETAHIRYEPLPRAPDLVGSGTGGSRGALGTGSAFSVLGRKLIELARPHAAAALRVPESGLRYSNGKFHSGRHSLGFVELARKLARVQPHPLNTIAEGTFGTTYPNGCHIAEVEIDPDTGTAAIVRYTAVDDLGTVISPILVEGQVHGGVVQGAGQVFGEKAVYEPVSAQLLTGSFMDYVMPRAGWLRKIDVHDHPVPTPTNALGAKGVGESGCSGSLPALVNATVDALRPLGITHLDMPFTPCRLWDAIQAVRPTGSE
ncbi:MAG: xanthine dehydrogenase family protein molybdopterin-binding subunit [Gammaproteobacteria bacterium]|nr:xanthine dehydrogenase family protein molybdopterin-binding subunit [Gammaproteobacteria bacterium]MDH3411759.1 xanthine dehydrogenase family protein molybdopterin-binding subunit [Gammaproteobacteria bacterium]